MSATLDLDRYFSRIGYHGPRAATLEVLREIHALHPLAIPFENLAALTGRRVALDLPSVVEKLIEGGRGGYCFEQNRLFAHALMQLGFNVTPMLARVLWGQAPDAIMPLTHMMLRVDIDDEAWIADVGFGGVTLTEPLRLQTGTPQQTRLEAFRLADASRGAFDLEVQSGDVWTKVYRFELARAEWVDYEVANWFTSAEPDSLFVNHLLACRVLPEGRLALFDTAMTRRGSRGELVAEWQLENADALSACLREEFGLTLDGIDMDAVFSRVANTR
ncbi:arylamine N-acetyltransferase [Paraburkholderia sp.]|uniref:arylamine N-acetyltransferase family protein n=1 Tax=Paraburkholderia sp. TaxID=1926495 RepID=UPI002397E16C|nr:arylamine N-acetyltransferase [Paraburkholderia sp.]MDE1181743.1 arylamine N-acetyltransferase [Paraburkholderia sp.]